MTASEIIEQLRPLGRESYKRVLLNHGVGEPVFGIKIEDMKKIQKQVKKDYRLALDLFDSGIYDFQYLAGLIADDLKMTKKDLQRWVESGRHGISEYTVPWVAAESHHGFEMALKWIDAKKDNVMASGWATLASLAAIKDDAELDLPAIKKLLQRVQKSIHQAPNRVRYVMNNFVIAVGSYIKELSAAAIATAKAIGPVSIDMGDTSCKTPDAVEYIAKAKARGTLDKKRKSAKC